MLTQTLYNYLLDQDIPSSKAKLAAKRCSRAINKGTITGFGVGMGIGLATSNPGALIMGIAGGLGGGSIALLAAPACEEVREAAMKLAGDEMLGFR